MKYIYHILLAILVFLPGCSTVQLPIDKPEGWYNVAVIEGVEYFVDTISIRRDASTAFAREKRIYVTEESKEQYVDKIRTKFVEMGRKAEKAAKWNDFSYCIYNCFYDCTNKRFKILSVEDYDSSDKLIIRTTPPKKQERWLNVDADTVGDYTFFTVCDYAE